MERCVGESGGGAAPAGAPGGASGAAMPPRPQLLKRAGTSVALLMGPDKTEHLQRARHKTGQRAQLHRLLDEPRSSASARLVFSLIVFTVFFSVLVFYLRSVPSVSVPGSASAAVLRNCELFCVSVFTLELLLRCVVATLDVRSLCLCDAYFYIDVAAIIPTYSELVTGDSAGGALKWLQLLRLLRILKLLRHYSGWRVLLLALHHSWRALLVPVFAMLLCILLLSGALWLTEGRIPDSEDAFDDGFDAIWCIFWVVMALGFDGPMGSGGGVGQCIIAVAIITGLVLTTMPITVVGEAFREAWERREMIEVSMQVQEHLAGRGLRLQELDKVFAELDTDGNHELDWDEFKAALAMLGVPLSVEKARLLFNLFDEDASGAVGFQEFTSKIFPNTDWDVHDSFKHRIPAGGARASADAGGMRVFDSARAALKATPSVTATPPTPTRPTTLAPPAASTSSQHTGNGVGSVNDKGTAGGTPGGGGSSPVGRRVVLPPPPLSQPPPVGTEERLAALEECVGKCAEVLQRVLEARQAEQRNGASRSPQPPTPPPSPAPPASQDLFVPILFSHEEEPGSRDARTSQLAWMVDAERGGGRFARRAIRRAAISVGGGTIRQRPPAPGHTRVETHRRGIASEAKITGAVVRVHQAEEGTAEKANKARPLAGKGVSALEE